MGRCKLGFVGAAVLSVVLLAFLPAATSAAQTRHAHTRHGGTLVVLNTNLVSWGGLDPSTPTGIGDATDLDQAIFGQLFAFGSQNQIVPQMATKYSYSDHNLELTITIRRGIVFSNGDPFNAQAVASSMQYTLAPSTACACDATFSMIKSIAATGPLTVRVTLSKSYAPLMASIVDSALDFIVDTKVRNAEGETAFAQRPVGAGPYVVSQNIDSTSVVLKRNAHYYQKGVPYVSAIKYEPSASAQTALEDVESGEAQLIEQLTTIGGSGSAIISSKRAGLNVTTQSGTANNDLELNSMKPPFNNIKAREAVYYATDSKEILKYVASNFGSVSESPSGPGGEYYEQKVPGYRGYNLAKAKKLVKELGGLTFQIAGGNFAANYTLAEALQKMYEVAGMHVTLNMETLANLVSQFEAGNWQSSVETAGDVDPDIGVAGLVDRFECKEPFSGTCDPTLESLINRSAVVINSAARKKTFDEIYADIAREAYAPFLYVEPNAVVSAKSVHNITMPGGWINFAKISMS